MKILFVHDRMGALAGAEANAFITANELKSRGHVVGLVHGSATGKGVEKWEKTFEPRFPLDGVTDGQLVSAAVLSFDPDMVYVHKMASLPVLQALVDSGRPLVRMVHDHDIYCMRSYKYNALTRKICHRPATPYCIFPCGAFLARNHEGGLPIKWVSYFGKKREIALNRRFDRMVVVTEYMRQELLQNGFDPGRIEIHPPVPRMGDLDITSSFSSRNLIVFAGQIIRGKGVDILLKALALMKQPFECIILGDGSHLDFCRKKSRELGLVGRVKFPGFVPQEELKNYYRECTVVAVPSVWPEPFATIGMEVMRYGIPVVAFDVGGLRDWLKHEENGFLVPWMDHEQFAARLDQLLLDKDLARRLGASGLDLVTKNYDFNRYIENLVGMFGRVVEGAGGR